MKKIMSFVLAAAALTLSASCQKEVNPYDLGNADTPVTVTVQLPEGINTKAYGDGTQVDKVYYEIWTEGFEKRVYPETGKANVELVNNTATIEFVLVRGGVYSFVFWAMDDSAQYEWETMKAIDMKYTASDTGIAEGNIETRDAFYGTETITITAGTSANVTLKRPFAQLNFGADDMDTSVAGTLTLTSSSVIVENVATKFDATSGNGSAGSPITFTATGAALTESLDDTYTRLSTNYILPVGKNEKAVVKVAATFVATDETAKEYSVTHTFEELPIQQNYRTNVTGAIFTAKGSVTTTVSAGFDAPAYPNPITSENKN